MRVLLAFPALIIAACAGPQPPQTPPTYTPPPPVAESGLVVAAAEGEFPMGAGELRAFMDANPLTEYLKPIGDIAAPVEGTVLQGNWPEEGAARRLRLEDGHYIIERILINEPDLFKYQIWVFTNSAGHGIDQIVGEQRWIDLGPGRSRFEWDYKIKPRFFVLRPFIARMRSNTVEPYLQGAVDRMAEDIDNRGLGYSAP